MSEVAKLLDVKAPARCLAPLFDLAATAKQSVARIRTAGCNPTGRRLALWGTPGGKLWVLSSANAGRGRQGKRGSLPGCAGRWEGSTI